MLIDHRAYRILPGRVPAQLDLYSKLAYPVQLRYMGEPHFYLTAESGELNTIVHGWVYDSAGARHRVIQCLPCGFLAPLSVWAEFDLAEMRGEDRRVSPVAEEEDQVAAHEDPHLGQDPPPRDPP